MSEPAIVVLLVRLANLQVSLPEHSIRTTAHKMNLLCFPNELLLMIAKELESPKDVSSLLQANRHLASFLSPVLYDSALHTRYYREAALFWAVASGNEPMVRFLVEGGFQGHGNHRLVHRTTGKCDGATLKWVLEEGVDLVIGVGYKGQTALEWAVWHGREALTTLLLARGAYLRMAFYMAVQRRNEMIIDLLFAKGDITFADDGTGKTLLHEAVRGCNEPVVRSLLDRGADVAAMDYKLYTPLLTAVQHGDKALNIVELLLERGADPQDRDYVNRTALHLAAANKGAKTIELLLERGADANAQDDNQRTPLHAAVQYKCPVIDLLLENGADIDTQDTFGRTALSLAAQQVSRLMVGRLLEKGADTTIADNYGRIVPDWVLRKREQHETRKTLNTCNYS